jgi:ADP-ribosylglycohydrolase
MYPETFAYSHILGGLYGLALGDAWAMPALLRPRQTWDRYGGWIETLVAAPDDHPVHAGLLPGQVTDDTQQAMALAAAIAAEGTISVQGTANALIEWYDQIGGDGSPYVGPSTRKAVKALKAGVDPYQSGLRGDTNGAVMRITPVGLVHPGDPESAVADAVTACIPTHYTDVAVSGACAVAAAVAQAMVPDTTLEDIINTAVWGAEIGLQRGMPWFGASVARKIEFAVQLATDYRLSERDRIQNLYDLIGCTLAVPDSVASAFGVLVMADGDPVQAAILAAALSGDADTAGSVACAIAGSWRSIDAIPMEYVRILREANPQYNFEESAEDLYEVAMKNKSMTTDDSAPTLSDILGLEPDE